MLNQVLKIAIFNTKKKVTLVKESVKYFRWSVKKQISFPHFLKFPDSPVNGVHHKRIGYSREPCGMSKHAGTQLKQCFNN